MVLKTKIIIADDHHLVRQGFKALLEGIDFVEVVGEAANGQQVLHLLRHGKYADVVIMDVEMPVLDGLETAKQITQDFLGTRVIMLTMLNDKAIIEKAVTNGAKGFLFKNTSMTELAQAIQRVAAGDTYFSSEVAMILLSQASSVQQKALAQLSEREVEVLKLIAEGFSSTEIGDKLFISPRTVDTHRNNLIHKLQVNGIAGLVKFAIQHRLV
ncbi:MAG: response regulator transcription factor [Spirosomataceae bacterium]